MSGAAAEDGDAGCAQGAEMGFQDETNGITSASLLLFTDARCRLTFGCTLL